jgi:hypothetical protein
MSFSLTYVVFDAEAGALTADRTLGGSVVLRGAVDALCTLKDQPKDGQSVKVEAQLLPSPLRYADKLVAYSNVGHTRAVTLNDRAQNRMPFSAVVALDRDTVNALELARAGKAAEFFLDAQFIVREQGGTASSLPIQNLRYRVATSDWTEMLGNLGLFRSLLVEIPLSAKTDLTANTHLLHELHRAERLFRDGDYSGCVAVLRDVWDPLVKELDAAGRWDAILERSLPVDMASLMSAYAKALRTLVNKGHHREVASGNGSALYNFSAHDAELLYQASMGFLRYLGLLAR